jgi:Skp family chaperone for outer membrane proteins
MPNKWIYAPALLGLIWVREAAAQKVAVVNVPVVSERYRKTADLEAQFDAVRTRLKQERDAMTDRLERARRSLVEEIKPGTSEYHDRRKQIALLEAEIQWFVETEGARIERGLADSLRSIFTDVQQTVAEVAKEKGYDVVVAADQLPPEAPENPNQMKQQILLQKVLYWTPGVDITDDVVARLNAKYAASAPANTGGAETKPPPPSPPKNPGRPDP